MPSGFLLSMDMLGYNNLNFDGMRTRRPREGIAIDLDGFPGYLYIWKDLYIHCWRWRTGFISSNIQDRATPRVSSSSSFWEMDPEEDLWANGTQSWWRSRVNDSTSLYLLSMKCVRGQWYYTSLQWMLIIWVKKWERRNEDAELRYPGHMCIYRKLPASWIGYIFSDSKCLHQSLNIQLMYG